MAYSSSVIFLSMVLLVVCSTGKSPTSSPTSSPTKSPHSVGTPTAVPAPAVTINTPPFYVPGPVVSPSYISGSPSEAPAPSPSENAAPSPSNTVHVTGSLAIGLFTVCLMI